MPQIELSLAEWRAVAHELGSDHNAAAPRGLAERIPALLTQSTHDRPEQACALELDASSAEAVRAVYASRHADDQHAGQRAASVAEAIRIIHDHPQRHYVLPEPTGANR